MSADRLHEVVEHYLDRAAEAAKNRSWATVVTLSRDALTVDPNSVQAQRLLQLALQHVDRPDAAAGRRRVTMLFADLVGSTPLSGRHDPEDYVDLLQRYVQASRTAILRYRGHVIDVRGDGIVAVFGHPVASEDDALRAAAAGVELVDHLQAGASEFERRFGEPIAARVGLHSGLVVTDDRGYPYGETANIAARVQGEAARNSVVVSGATAALIADDVTLRSLGNVQLKGVQGAVELLEIIDIPERKGRLPADRIVPLVGREAELATLDEAWHASQSSGSGTMIVVVGDAGIGKSRLVEELRSSVAAAGHRTIVMPASSLDASASLHPVLTGLRASLGIDRGTAPVEATSRVRELLNYCDLLDEQSLAIMASLLAVDDPAVGSPTLEPAQLREARLALLLRLVERFGSLSPLLLVVEDLHWADPTTIELLRRLAAQGLPPGLAIIVTTRPVVDRFDVDGAVTVELGALDADDSRRLIRSLGGGVATDERQVDAIARRGDGVPLYLEQLVLADGPDGGPVPPSLSDLLQSRIDATGAGKAVAQLAAVLGRAFERPLLEAALDELRRLEPEDAAVAVTDHLDVHLDRLLAARLMEHDGLGVRFHHALVRDAAYGSQLHRERPARHEAAARALEARSALEDPSHHARVATHFELAGRLDSAAEHWLLAARRARRAGDSDEAAAHLEHVEAILAGLDVDGGRLVELELRSMKAALLTGSMGYGAPGAAEQYQRSLELCDALAGDERSDGSRVQTLLGLWTYLFNTGDLDGSSEILDRLEELARTTDYPAIGATIGATRGVELVYRGRLAEARDLIDRAEAAFAVEQIDLDRWPLPNDCLAAALALRALAEVLMGDREASIATIDSACQRAEALGYPFGPYSLAFVRGFEAWVCQLGGDVVRAQAAAAEVVEIAGRHGFGEWSLVGAVHLAIGSIGQREPDAILAELAPLVRLYRASGAQLGLPAFIGAEATCHALAGRAAAAASLADEAIDLAASTGQSMLLPDLHRVRAIASAGLGSQNETVEHLARGRALAAGQANAAAVAGVQETEQLVAAAQPASLGGRP